MASGSGTKLRAFGELIRLDLTFGAGFFLVAGEIVALGGMPPLSIAVPGFFALFFISGSANISNDYFDREVDRINLPTRPLPSGRVSVRELWVLFSLCSVIGLACAWLLGPVVFALSVSFWALSLLYNIRLKEYGVFGNLVVATCVGMTVILGGIAAGVVNGVVVTLGLLAFFFDMGEEIAADAMDVKGDEVRSSASLAKSRGRAPALRLSAVFFGIFLALSLVPYAGGWLGTDYLILVGLLDLFIIGCVLALVRSPTTDEGRVQIRRLYLVWGAFMVVFALSRVL